jgi:hypothetical protein
MNTQEAPDLLERHLATFVGRSYAELVSLIDRPQTMTAKGASGTEYQLEFEVFYDSKRGGDIRIMGHIDDGGMRAFSPLTIDEIMRPTGELV